MQFFHSPQLAPHWKATRLSSLLSLQVHQAGVANDKWQCTEQKNSDNLFGNSAQLISACLLASLPLLNGQENLLFNLNCLLLFFFFILLTLELTDHNFVSRKSTLGQYTFVRQQCTTNKLHFSFSNTHSNWMMQVRRLIYCMAQQF